MGSPMSHGASTGLTGTYTRRVRASKCSTENERARGHAGDRRKRADLYYVACSPLPKASGPSISQSSSASRLVSQVSNTSPPRFYTFGRNSTHILRFNRQFLVTKHTSHGTFFSVLYYVALSPIKALGPGLSQSSSVSRLVPQVPVISSPRFTLLVETQHIFSDLIGSS